jgi:hypothetical protein
VGQGAKCLSKRVNSLPLASSKNVMDTFDLKASMVLFGTVDLLREAQNS